ncbi:MAG: RluA family pseudouridine synthase [Desulfonauticus sp.]|nr:RluA family pseudouridine synthase [Desulfonauticus sp.]
MPYFSVQHIKVDASYNQQKLISFLKQKTQGTIPYSGLMKWIRTGQVRVNKSRTSPFYRLQEGDVIRIPPYSAEKTYLQPQVEKTYKLNIVYEDRNLLIIDKPCGLPVHKGSKNLFSLMDIIASNYGKQGFLPTPVHRLDKDTSGLLILAKSFKTLRELQAHWSCVHKYYLTKVWGKWPYPKPKEFTHYLYKTKGKIVIDKLQGKKCSCYIHLLAQTKNCSILKIKLLTGRTRQLRAQLHFLGHPIVGDKKFNPTCSSSTFYLHAYCLKLQDKTIISLPNWKNIDFNSHTKDLS